MSSLLGKIRSFVDNFAVVISDIVDTDVIITDSNMDIVGSKFKYFSLYKDIKIGSLISDVLINNHNLLIENKRQIPSCRECEQFESCKIQGFVGVPIRYEKQVLGVIALILPKSRVKTLFETIDSTITFMENMADLVAVRMINHIEKKGLRQKILQIESILDLMEDAVLYTDIYGNVIYINHSFKEEFYVDAGLIGKNICKVYPEFIQWIDESYSVENLKVTINHYGQNFYGLLNRKQVSITEGQYGLIFSLRPHKNISTNSLTFVPGTIVTLPWLEKFMESEWTEIAAKYAELDSHLLICGEEQAMNELLAKGIANHSNRRLNAIKIIYMQNVYRDLMDSYLLGEYGVVRNMDGGILVIVQPEQMPLYLQDKFAEIMRTGKLEISSGRFIAVNVRFIFCTIMNLGAFAKENTFSKKLYQIISEHILCPETTIHNNKQFFMKYCAAGLRYYNKIYCTRRKQDIVNVSLMERIWSDCRSVPLGMLETILECIVRDGSYKGKEINFYDKEFRPRMASVKEMEEQQIRRMVELGYTRQEMEEILQISRTTLYRKLKEYHLLVKKARKGKISYLSGKE
ncbi:MAG: sigma 54-interacting transcriptional regulator [Acetivibrio ethanolgignens]